MSRPADRVSELNQALTIAILALEYLGAHTDENGDYFRRDCREAAKLLREKKTDLQGPRSDKKVMKKRYSNHQKTPLSGYVR